MHDSPSVEGYEVGKLLGEGGYGSVYLARNNSTGSQVALKVMRSKHELNKMAHTIFVREIENTKALEHPNVVRLLDFGSAQGQLYFTLEYCNGGSVDELMRHGGGTLSVGRALRITCDGLNGLDYAHTARVPHVALADGSIAEGRGLVHRDIKPGNIFISRKNTETSKLGDFGLSKAFDLAGLSGVTKTGAAYGTPFFVPRQHVLEYKYAKPEVDVWAMAASFYNMVTGDYPREFPPRVDPWEIVLTTDPIPIRERDRSIPEDVADIIDHALDDRSGMVFATAQEFREALLSLNET